MDKSVVMYRNPLARGTYRNNPCVCGSGKKVKACHGRDNAVTEAELQDIIKQVDRSKREQLQLMKSLREAEAAGQE